MHTCPLCNAALELPPDVIEGEIIPCADCGCEAEVRSIDPIKLEPAPAIEEDWGE